MASEFLEIGKQTILLKLWSFEVIAKDIGGIYLGCTGFSSLKLKLHQWKRVRVGWFGHAGKMRNTDCGMGQGIDLR